MAALQKTKKDVKTVQDSLDTITAELEASKRQLAQSQEGKKEAEARVAVTEKQMLELQKTLTTELQEGERKDRDLASLTSDLSLLKESKGILEEKIRDQEQTLTDMATKLQAKDRRLDEMSELNDSNKTEGWVDDASIRECMKCGDPFSLNKRKVRNPLQYSFLHCGFLTSPPPVLLHSIIAGTAERSIAPTARTTR